MIRALELTFKIVSQFDINASHLYGLDADFYVEEKDLMESGYYVLYYIYATQRVTKDNIKLLGEIKIMKIGQKECERHIFDSITPNSYFSELPDNYVSISLDFYLFKWLSTQSFYLRQKFAKSLNMILSKSSPFYKLVKDDFCFIYGMLGFNSMDNYVFYKANEWINGEDRKYDLRAQSIKIKFDNCDETIPLSFSSLNDVKTRDLPNGIVAFIGSNGSGKSTALYSLAKAMYLYPNQRAKLERNFCTIIPNDIGVEKLILISYSPFDNFTFPSDYNHAMHIQPFKKYDLRGLHFETDNYSDPEDERFIYCGIRDLDEENRILQKRGVKKDLSYIQHDRYEVTVVKTQKRFADDFESALNQLKKKSDRIGIWKQIIRNASVNFPDIKEIMEIFSSVSAKSDNRQEQFMELSTGYKYFLHSLAYVIAYIKEGSLILFDEPENHIHPPLLSFMMAQYREILSIYNSVMLVSTHSPVIVQELFADNVLKVYRDGDKIRIKKPMIETYGATFGEINSEVFGLTSDVSRYFDAIDYLYETWGLNNKNSVRDMLDEIKIKFKRPVSNQIASYLINKYYSDNPEKD